MGVTPLEVNGIYSHPVLEYLSKQVSPPALSGARFIKSIIASGLIFLLKYSIDFQGGYSHPVTQKHHPQQFLCWAGRGTVFSPGMSWFKSHRRCCYQSSFPTSHGRRALPLEGSVALLLPSVQQQQQHSLGKSPVRLRCAPGLPHAGDPPLPRPGQDAPFQKLGSCKPCWLHGHTFEDNCSAGFFSLADWASHPRGWLWALHADWRAVPAHLPGLLAEANGRDCRHNCWVSPVGFLSRSTPTMLSFWSVNGNTWISLR